MEDFNLIGNSDRPDDDDNNNDNEARGIITFTLKKESMEKIQKISELLLKFTLKLEILKLPPNLLDIIINILTNGMNAANILHSSLIVARITEQQKDEIKDFINKIASGQLQDETLSLEQVMNICNLITAIEFGKKSEKVNELVGYMKGETQ